MTSARTHVLRCREQHGTRWIAYCGRSIENAANSARIAEATCTPCVRAARDRALWQATVHAKEARDGTAQLERLLRAKRKR